MRKIKLAALISGRGSTLKNLIDRVDEGSLDVSIKIVISSNSKAFGLNHAKDSGIDTSVISPQDFNGTMEFSDALTEELDKHSVDLVLLAGFSHFFHISDKYKGKVMNIHPGLIPSFCGRGYYGIHVHKAVLDYGAKISGCTVHFADNKYDNGPIILQRTVPVMENDTPDTLAERVAQEEHLAYPEAIKLFADGKLKIIGRKVKIGENDID